MSRLTRDGTAEPVSRDQILRHARGQGNVHFPCSADHEQDWQPYPVDPYSAICDDHTYIHTYIVSGRNPPLYCILCMESTSHVLSFRMVFFYIPCDHGLAGRPGSSEVPRKPLTRWDVSSIPANGIFLTKKLKNKIKMPNGWRTIKSLVHKIRLHSRREKGMAESFSREKLRHAQQKEGG